MGGLVNTRLFVFIFSTVLRLKSLGYCAPPIYHSDPKLKISCQLQKRLEAQKLLIEWSSKFLLSILMFGSDSLIAIFRCRDSGSTCDERNFFLSKWSFQKFCKSAIRLIQPNKIVSARFSRLYPPLFNFLPTSLHFLFKMEVWETRMLNEYGLLHWKSNN